MDEITEKPLFALEEQLARQKAILTNGKLVQKLPDKGAKVRDSVAKIEAEIERRKKEVAANDQRTKVLPDVSKLEWVLRINSQSSDPSPSSTAFASGNASGENAELDSDDDIEVDEDQENEKNDEGALKLIATSQITQRQAKPVIDESKFGKNESTLESNLAAIKPDPYLIKLVEQDVMKESHVKHKFLPAKTLKKTSGSSSPARSESSISSTSSSKKNKWDEALLPPKLNSEGVKLLSMEDTIKVSCDKYKQAEVTKATAPPKKTYAYDKLRDQGLLGSYTVEMQTSRPVRPDIEDDDLEDDDLSHDSITEESESEDSDASDDEKNKDAAKAKEKTSKDLSSLLNKSLKLS